MRQRSTRFAERAQQLQEVRNCDGVVKVDVCIAVRHATKVGQQEQHVFHTHHAVAREVTHTGDGVGGAEGNELVAFLVKDIVEEDEEHLVGGAFAERDVLGWIIGVEWVRTCVVVRRDAMKRVARGDLGQRGEREEALPVEIPRRDGDERDGVLVVR